MSVGLVIVSHSSAIARGVVELAGQMAPHVILAAAGGTDDGGIGTSFARVNTALELADSGDGVIVLCDLGSAVLLAETAVDFLTDDARARTRIVDAPLVEGAVAAAVAAETGGDLGAVQRAAETAWVRSGGIGEADPQSGPQAVSEAETASDPAIVTAETVLVNPSGLHARPAAEFVKLAAKYRATVTVNGTDAKSLLRIMSLGLSAGSTVQLSAEGTDAAEAVAALVALVDSGFGE